MTMAARGGLLALDLTLACRNAFAATCDPERTMRDVLLISALLVSTIPHPTTDRRI